jgi:hypothetical protein
VVSEALGHSSVSFTLDRYSHVLPGMGEAAASAIGRGPRRAHGESVSDLVGIGGMANVRSSKSGRYAGLGGGSSVGQSSGLIIRWSLVRIQPAPPSELRL